MYGGHNFPQVNLGGGRLNILQCIEECCSNFILKLKNYKVIKNFTSKYVIISYFIDLRVDHIYIYLIRFSKE